MMIMSKKIRLSDGSRDLGMKRRPFSDIGYEKFKGLIFLVHRRGTS